MDNSEGLILKGNFTPEELATLKKVLSGEGVPWKIAKMDDGFIIAAKSTWEASVLSGTFDEVIAQVKN